MVGEKIGFVCKRKISFVCGLPEGIWARADKFPKTRFHLDSHVVVVRSDGELDIENCGLRVMTDGRSRIRFAMRKAKREMM